VFLPYDVQLSPTTLESLLRLLEQPVKILEKVESAVGVRVEETRLQAIGSVEVGSLDSCHIVQISSPHGPPKLFMQETFAPIRDRSLPI
jgi:hypothetical protein